MLNNLDTNHSVVKDLEVLPADVRRCSPGWTFYVNRLESCGRVRDQLQEGIPLAVTGGWILVPQGSRWSVIHVRGVPIIQSWLEVILSGRGKHAACSHRSSWRQFALSYHERGLKSNKVHLNYFSN